MNERCQLARSARIVMRREIFTNFFTNFLFNALCAWLINRSKVTVNTDFWNVLLDISITSFCTCNLTTFFSVAAAKRYTKAGIFSGKIPYKGWLCDLPSGPVLLGACLMGVTGLPLGALLGIGFTFLRIPVLPFKGFVLYKGIFGGILGACICAAVLFAANVRKGGALYE